MQNTIAHHHPNNAQPVPKQRHPPCQYPSPLQPPPYTHTHTHTGIFVAKQFVFIIAGALLQAVFHPARRRWRRHGTARCDCLSSLVWIAFHLAFALTARALDKWRGPAQVKSILTFASGVTGL